MRQHDSNSFSFSSDLSLSLCPSSCCYFLRLFLCPSHSDYPWILCAHYPSRTAMLRKAATSERSQEFIDHPTLPFPWAILQRRICSSHDSLNRELGQPVVNKLTALRLHGDRDHCLSNTKRLESEPRLSSPCHRSLRSHVVVPVPLSTPSHFRHMHSNCQGRRDPNWPTIYCKM